MTNRGRIAGKTKNDDLTRTVNFRYNGSLYAIQFDGKSCSHWLFNESKNEIEKGDYRPVIDSNEQFIFTLEKVSDASSVGAVFDEEIKPHVFAENNRIRVKVSKPLEVAVFSNSGLLVSRNFGMDDLDIPVLPGIYMVYLKSETESFVQKIIVR